MTNELENKLLAIAQKYYKNNDSSHDFMHAIRVLTNAKLIVEKESGDLDVIIPAAIFHDVICYPKDSDLSTNSTKDSAKLTENILRNISEYPKHKIELVKQVILECSFSKGIIPNMLESKIIQDADRIEATGAIAIMRTFASAGVMNSNLYSEIDPFCQEREPDSKNYALDLFYTRLLKVKEILHTETAKILATKREKILIEFLESLKEELSHTKK